MGFKQCFPIVILPAMLISMSCTAEYEPQQDLQQGELIAFSVANARGISRSSTLDDFWTAEQIIAISEGTRVLPYVADITSAISGGSVMFNPVVTSENRKPLTSEAFFWSPVCETKSFTAWYPYTSEKISTPKVVTVRSDQRSSNECSDRVYRNYDLLYSTTSAEYKQTAVFSFYHQLSRVIVNVNGSATTTKVESIDFGSDNVSVSGTIKTFGTSGLNATGTKVDWEEITTEQQIHTIYMRCTHCDDDNQVYTYECILPPQSSNGATTLFTIQGTRKLKDNTWKNASYSYTAAFVLKPGYQYVYRLNTSKSGGVSLASATITNWQSTGAYGGTADYDDISYPDFNN